jgi:hypothetical protein
MMNKLLLLAVLASLSLLVCVQAQAAVITFDDLGIPSGGFAYPMPSGYAGLTWGNVDSSYWGALDQDYTAGYAPQYGIPHSGTCMAYNGDGVDALWFDFGAPVTFNGAWFATAPGSGSSASMVMLSDDLGDTTSWLTLTDAPQFLGPNWAGATRITVSRDTPNPTFPTQAWYTMDDVTYDADGAGAHGSPELSTWMLLACSGLAGLGLWRRRKA